MKMNIPRRAMLATAAALAALAFVACGDDGSDDGNGDGQQNEATPQATSIPRDPLPTVVGRTVTSTAKGYTATYPEGWEPRYDIALAPGQKLDAYFGPPRAEEGQFRATITIACEQITGSEDSRAYYERKRAVTESTAVGQIIGPETTSISGVPAYRIEYQLDAGEQEVRKIDVFAANDTCGYTISLASSPEELAQHLSIWQQFLNDLKLS
jgi:hypothetical protein